MRVVKEHDERMGEFVDAAIALMSRKGYEGTTIQDIIDEVGVSKGAFYHYFSSKEDILDAIAERICETVLKRTEDSIRDASLPADEKLRRFLATTWHWKSENVDVAGIFLPIMYADENVRLRNRAISLSKEFNNSILSQLAEQGVREGVFNIKYPEETVDLAFQIIVAGSESSVDIMLSTRPASEKARLLRRWFALILETIEKLFGAKPGSLGRVPESYVKKLSMYEVDAEGPVQVTAKESARGPRAQG